MLAMSSVVGDSWLGNEIERNKKYVTTDIHKAFIYAKRLSDERCLMKMVINADPHIDYIP